MVPRVLFRVLRSALPYRIPGFLERPTGYRDRRFLKRRRYRVRVLAVRGMGGRVRQCNAEELGAAGRARHGLNFVVLSNRSIAVAWRQGSPCTMVRQRRFHHQYGEKLVHIFVGWWRA